MHVTLVHVQVKPDCLDKFIAATRANHIAAVKEPGNLRFDVLQSADDPHLFVLYEAYINAEAAAAHKSTAHYLTWRDSVADIMSVPRRGIAYKGLFPKAHQEK